MKIQQKIRIDKHASQDSIIDEENDSESSAEIKRMQTEDNLIS